MGPSSLESACTGTRQFKGKAKSPVVGGPTVSRSASGVDAPKWPSIDVLDQEMLRIRARRRGRGRTGGRKDAPATPQSDTPSSPATQADPISSVAKNRRIAAYTSADQVLSSLSNALLLFAVAQTATVSLFGVIALLVAVMSIWMCFNRGALGAPLLLASNLQVDQIRTEAGYAITWAGISGLGAALALCVVGLHFDQAAIAVAFAATVPVVLIQDVLRYAAISLRRPLVAISSDGLWMLVILSVFLANAFGAEISPLHAVVIWGCSGLAGVTIVVARLRIKPKFDRLYTWWKTYASARRNFGIVDALSPAYVAAALIIVTTLVDSAVAGSLRGASTLLGPIYMLLSTLPLIFVPYARRSATSARVQWKLLVKISLVTAALAVLAAAAFFMLPAGLGRAMMGDTWDSAVGVIMYEGLGVAGNCWMASLLALFQAQGRSRIAFWIRLFQACLQLLTCFVVALAVGTAATIAAWIAASIWVTVSIGVVLGRRVVLNPVK